MPKYTLIDGQKVATEAELLRFANVIRQAGGAEVLEALLPSQPAVANQCLIANALNFSCEVDRGPLYPAWHMAFPDNMDEDRIREIAKAAHCRVRRPEPEEKLVIQLPEHIGNTAWAFDERLAFTEYIR